MTLFRFFSLLLLCEIHSAQAQVHHHEGDEDSSPEWCLGEPSPEVLNRQIYEVLEASRQGPPECPVEVKGKKVLFAFEGASGYSPAQFQLEQKRSENVQSEKKSISLLSDSRVIQKIRRENRKTLSEPVLLLGLLSQKMDRLNSEKITILYYSQKHSEEAAICAESIFKKRKSLELNTEFAAVGFSMGGFAAYEFAKILEDKSISIQFVLTVDPVRKGLRGIGDVIGRTQNQVMHKTSNVRRWVNIFQRQDTKSLRIGIRGSSVRGADENLELTSPGEVRHSREVKEIDLYDFHMTIPSHPAISKAFDQLF